MSQPFNTQASPGAAQAIGPSAADQTAAVVADLTRRMKNGANNFYWIAALSFINSLVLEFGGGTFFVVGLAGTLLVDGFFIGLAEEFPNSVVIIKLIGLVISFIGAGIFALFGLLAGRGKRWAFITGIVLYVVDALLMLLFQEWMGLLFHLLFLWGLLSGLRFLNERQKLLSQRKSEFPQSIGVS